MKAAVTRAPPNALKFSRHRSDLRRSLQLQQSQPETGVDDLLGQRNDVLFGTFLKIGRAVEQWRGRPARIDRRSPAFADRINLQAIAFIFYNVCR
jgi:hypothetical protein